MRGELRKVEDNFKARAFHLHPLIPKIDPPTSSSIETMHDSSAIIVLCDDHSQASSSRHRSRSVSNCCDTNAYPSIRTS